MQVTGGRYYHSNLGQWLNRDPIGERGGPDLLRALLNASPQFYDSLGESCCGRRGIGGGTDEGRGTPRPFGSRSRPSPCPGDDMVSGFPL